MLRSINRGLIPTGIRDLPGLRFPLTQPKLSWRIVKGILGRICATFLGLPLS